LNSQSTPSYSMNNRLNIREIVTTPDYCLQFLGER
jgi:hypothetical protein